MRVRRDGHGGLSAAPGLDSAVRIHRNRLVFKWLGPSVPRGSVPDRGPPQDPRQVHGIWEARRPPAVVSADVPSGTQPGGTEKRPMRARPGNTASVKPGPKRMQPKAMSRGMTIPMAGGMGTVPSGMPTGGMRRTRMGSRRLPPGMRTRGRMITGGLGTSLPNTSVRCTSKMRRSGTARRGTPESRVGRSRTRAARNPTVKTAPRPRAHRILRNRGRCKGVGSGGFAAVPLPAPLGVRPSEARTLAFHGFPPHRAARPFLRHLLLTH